MESEARDLPRPVGLPLNRRYALPAPAGLVAVGRARRGTHDPALSCVQTVPDADLRRRARWRDLGYLWRQNESAFALETLVPDIAHAIGEGLQCSAGGIAGKLWVVRIRGGENSHVGVPHSPVRRDGVLYRGNIRVRRRRRR